MIAISFLVRSEAILARLRNKKRPDIAPGPFPLVFLRYPPGVFFCENLREGRRRCSEAEVPRNAIPLARLDYMSKCCVMSLPNMAAASSISPPGTGELTSYKTSPKYDVPLVGSSSNTV